MALWFIFGCVCFLHYLIFHCKRRLANPFVAMVALWLPPLYISGIILSNIRRERMLSGISDDNTGC